MSLSCFFEAILKIIFLVAEKTNEIRLPSSEELYSKNVIITTLSSAHILWKYCHNNSVAFTHILIDEAAQALEPECLVPIVMAHRTTKIVLAGDHLQVCDYLEKLFNFTFQSK